MTQQGIATRAPTAPKPRRRAGRIVFWALVGLALAALLASIAFLVLTINPYFEQSTSMQPTMAPGDRILAVQGSSGLRRGDIVVLRVPAKISGTDDLFVKRVIGLPGDRVACCNANGEVTVDGKPLNETYLYPGDRPSRTTFSVTVGKGEIWVMGDHRNISVDSRKWGPVPVHGVVGRVILIGHGHSFTVVRTPRTFVADGLAPPDTRPDLYADVAIALAASVAALLLLAVFGITRFVIRRLRPSARTGGAGPPPTAPRPLVEPLYGVYRVPSPRSEPKPGPARQKPSPPKEKLGPATEKLGPAAERLGPAQETLRLATQKPDSPEEQPDQADETPEPTAGPAEQQPNPADQTPDPADETPDPAEQQPNPADESPGPADQSPDPADQSPDPAEEKPGPDDKPGLRAELPDPAKAGGGS